MVTLPEIESYTSEELSRAKALSPAIKTYLPFLEVTPKSVSDEWRIFRHRHWIQCALASLLERSKVEDVCAFWSQCTRELLLKVWQHHELPQQGLCLLPMGKWGANELNLSSDIDIIWVSDQMPEKSLSKKVRQFIQSLTEVTPLGFCYRVDLDLRPGGTSAPLIISEDQFTNHYGYHGETWERLAMIRMGPALGDSQLSRRLSDFCQKFAFRKHIDLSLFTDLLNLREKIRSSRPYSFHKNLKFSPGGIRELELFVHSLLLIHGGKNPQIAKSSMTDSLEQLGKTRILKKEDAERLQMIYWLYRKIENKLHSEKDQHTYDLPLNPTPAIEAKDLQDFGDQSLWVAELMDQFLAPYAKKMDYVPLSELEDLFEKLQLKSIEVREDWEKLLVSEVKSREKSRDENERRLFLRSLLLKVEHEGIDKELAIRNLRQFLSSIQAKSSFFVLFNKHPELISEFSWIFSCSPYMAQILIRRPEIIDSFLLRSLDIDKSDENAFYKSLQDYKLLSDLLASTAYLRTRKLEPLQENLSHATDFVVRSLLKHLCEKSQVELDILTLGKWATREMGLRSDLDFVFVTREEPKPAHFKVARRLINFITSSAGGPPLYAIDLRLRPSGQAGPLLIPLQELKNYLSQQSKVWERQAYLSHRFLMSEETTPLFSIPPLSAEDLSELSEIQKKLLQPLGAEEMNIKKSVGGLIHTEFTLQIQALQSQKWPQSGRVINWISSFEISPEQKDQIQKNYDYLRRQQQLLTLLSDTPALHLRQEEPRFQKLAHLNKMTAEALFAEIRSVLLDQAELLKPLSLVETP